MKKILSNICTVINGKREKPIRHYGISILEKPNGDIEIPSTIELTMDQLDFAVNSRAQAGQNKSIPAYIKPYKQDPWITIQSIIPAIVTLSLTYEWGDCLVKDKAGNYVWDKCPSPLKSNMANNTSAMLINNAITLLKEEMIAYIKGLNVNNSTLPLHINLLREELDGLCMSSATTEIIENKQAQIEQACFTHLKRYVQSQGLDLLGSATDQSIVLVVPFFEHCDRDLIELSYIIVDNVYVLPSDCIIDSDIYPDHPYMGEYGNHVSQPKFTSTIKGELHEKLKEQNKKITH